MSAKGVKGFFNKLREDESLRKQLTTLDEGDWQGIIDIAKQQGFTFTQEELVAAVPEGFFKGGGTRPDLGWSKDTVESPNGGQ